VKQKCVVFRAVIRVKGLEEAVSADEKNEKKNDFERRAETRALNYDVTCRFADCDDQASEAGVDTRFHGACAV
jgi:hypothetical protein